MEQKINDFINNLKNKGHHGYGVPYGEAFYLFDKTDEVVYNIKTGKQLKWCWTDNNFTEEMKKKYSANCYVQLSDGHGGRSRRIRLKEFRAGINYVYGIKTLPIYMEEYDLTKEDL